MRALGSLWYTLGIDSKQIDADLKSVEAKLKNLGVTVDVSKVRQTIEASVGATPFNATVNFGNARASLDAIFANKKYDVHVEAIASKLHESIKNALANFSTGANILPKKKELRKAVNDALLSAGFEINIGKVKGLNATINNALGSAHTLNVSVDPKKLASAIDKAVGAYKGGKQVSVEVKDKILKDSITAALKTEKFPIRIIVDKAEAQDAVRQALQAAGLQSSTGFTASDKRAWDAQSRRMEAEARAAAASALAQRRLAGARSQAANAADKHATATISLNSALKGNITLTKELGGAIGAAYSVVALKNFMTKVVEIGGELEQQKLAMKAILGDEGMANTISSQINTLAVKSPFGIMELNQYAKQLTAFQIPYNELYDTMKRMADVSAAVGVDMGRIILAYGQVRAAKFLKGTELRQFTEANIPLIDMLAERFTKLKGEIVSAGDIMDMISNKEVSFEDVKAVLWELTGEGGRFYNMQEVLSESVSAKWKNLADALDLMFADIADSASGPLKGLAEILTELTSRWSTIASVASVAAIAFGGVKVASLLTARSLDASGSSALKAAANSALLERNNARLAQGYRTLTRDERKALGTSLSFWQTQKSMLASLSGAQFRQLALTGQITKEEWSRMIALGRLNDVQKKILVQTGVITQAELGRIRVLNRSLRTLEGWKRAFLGVGNAARSVGRALGALFLNPVTAMMAAIGTVTALWQRNSEEMAKAKEIGDNIATSASEGFRNLKSSLEKMQPSEGLTDTQLTQGIEEMQQLIKNYSPTPIEDINNALVAQDGHIRTLIEQYDFLSDRLKELKGAYFNIDNTFMGIAIEGALKATDGGNWFTQMFDDAIAENAKDYTNALGRVTDRIAKYSREYSNNMKSAINAASNADAGFKSATAGMESYEEKLRFLAENAELYHAASTAFDLDMNRWGYGEHIDYFSNANQIKAAREELLNDTDKFIADMNARLRQKGINPFLMTDQQKTELAIGLKSVLSQMEGAGEDAKALIAQKWEETWMMAGMIMEDKIGPSLQEKMRSFIGQSAEVGIVEISKKLKVEGYTALSDGEREIVDRLMEEAKTQTMSELGIMNADMQKYLTAHPLNQIITLAFATDTSNLYKEIVGQKGYPGLTNDVDKYVSAWTKGNSVFDARNAAQSALQKAKSELDAAKKAGVGVEAAQKEWDKVNAALMYLGWADITVKDQKSNKHPNESKKDPLAESLKQRLDILKKAYSEYKKELATMSKDAALERIKESGIFDELFTGEDAITDFDSYEATLKKLLADAEASLEGLSEKDSRFKGRHDLVISLRTLLNLEIPRDKTKKALDKAKREIDTLVSETTKKWDIYKRLFEFTGNKEASMKFAFGESVEWQSESANLKGLLDKQLEDKGLTDITLSISDEEAREKLEKLNLYDLWKKTKDAIENEEVELRINVAKAVVDAASTADKIKVQEGLRDTAVKEYRASEAFKEYGEEGAEAVAKPFNDKILELKSTMLQLLPVWEQIFGDREYASMKQLEQGMNAAQGIIDNAKIHYNKDGKADYFTSVVVNDDGSKQEIQGNISLLEKLRKAVVSLNKEAGKLNPFKRLADTLKEVFSKPKDGEKGDDPEIKLRKLGAAVSEVADMTGSLAGQLAEAFDAIGNVGMAQAMTDVQDVMNTVSNIGKGFAEGGLVGGIAAAAGEAIGWVTKAFQASARHKEALRAIMNETLAQQREYNLLLMQQNLEYKKAATILGEDTYGKAKNAVKVMKDAYASLNKELKGDEEYGKGYKIKISKDGIKRIDTLTEAQRNLYDSYAGLADIEIKTGHKKTGLFGWGKGKDIYSSILDVYPDLIDANGKFNSSLAETIINTRVMSDEDKAALQNMIDLAEQAEAAYEELNSYMTDIFGELGSSMTDALVSAFANGTDAAEDFYDSVSDMLEALAKQMIYSVTLAPLIEEAQKKMMDVMQDDSLSDEQKFDAWTGILDGLLDDALKQQGVANDLFKKYQDMAAEKGYDIFKPDEDSKSGLSAGIQSSITEDTGSLVASYCNGIRGDVSVQTHDYWPRLLDDALPQMNVIAQSQLDTQRQIAENTLRNAVAAETIVQYSKSIDDRLRRAQADKSTGFWTR